METETVRLKNKKDLFVCLVSSIIYCSVRLLSENGYILETITGI